jgi:hypothetical protein
MDEMGEKAPVGFVGFIYRPCEVFFSFQSVYGYVCLLKCVWGL